MNNNIEDFLTITNNGLDVDANNVNANCITSKNNTFSIDTNGNITCNSITSNVAQGLTFEQIYPIGAIYMSTANINPTLLFGGTWERIHDCFLIAVGNNYTLGETGGSTSHTHTMPNHYHGPGSMYAALQFDGTNGTKYKTKTGITYTPNERKADAGAGYSYSTTCTEGIQIYGNTESKSAGTTNSGSSMPPYLAVNVWKRTAY